MWVHDLVDADARCGGKAAALARLIGAGLPVPAGFAIESAAFTAVVGPIEIGGVEDIGHAFAAAERRIDRARATTELELEGASVGAARSGTGTGTGTGTDQNADTTERATATTTMPETSTTETATTPVELPVEFCEAVERRVAELGFPLIVRSSATIEDGRGGSAAGVFRSLHVDRPDQLWPAIRSVWASALTPLAASYARRVHAAGIAIGVIVQRRVSGEPVTVYTRFGSADAMWIQRRGVVEKVARDALPVALAAERAIDAESTGADVELVGEYVVQARPIVRGASVVRTPPPPIILAPLVADGRAWTWDASHNPAPLSVAQQQLVERVEAAGVAPWAMRIVGGYLYTTPRRRVAIDAPVTVEDLAARIAEIEGRMERELHDDRDAFDRYVAFYAIWANEYSPLIAAAARRVPKDVLLAHRPSRRPTSLAQIAHHSPAWDVAVPTYGELPELVDRLHAWPTAPEVPAGDPYARLVADLAERDDDWFYRAQWMVRRSILDRGEDPWGSNAARAAHARAENWAMPLTIPDRVRERASLRGVGIGPRVVGRVVHVDHEQASSGCLAPNSVAICRTVTPGLALFVVGAVALVSETDHAGLLDHGIALARELGITCVVGCPDASTLPEGSLVSVDGDSGIVELT